MSDLTREMKEYALASGADLVGVATPDRFADFPPERSPMSVFPEAQAVVVIGRRITRGTLRGTEEGTNLTLYGSFGLNWLNMQFLPLPTIEVTEWLEDRGWEATPLFPFPPEAYPQGVPVREGAPAPNVYPDFDHLAVAAGLAEMGYLGVALTPEFGHRQRWQIVITDAPLEGDPLLDAGLNDECRDCEDFCPLGAIDTSNEESIRIAGREFTVAGIDYSRCRKCPNGAQANPYHASGRPDRLAAVCMRTCMTRLEESGKLKTDFATPFRIRPTWGFDRAGDPVQTGGEG